MGGPGSGRKKLPKRIMKDAIDTIEVDKIIKRLQEWSKGEEVICPFCGERTGKRTADTVALQSAIELLNRRLGKPVQRHEVDITETIQLSADQVLRLLQRYQLAEAEFKELPGGEDASKEQSSIQEDEGNL